MAGKKQFVSFDFEFVKETDKSFGFKLKNGVTYIPKRFCEIETDQYKLVEGQVYKVFVQKWLADKNQLASGGVNDQISKKVVFLCESESGKAAKLRLPEGVDTWMPVSWIEDYNTNLDEGEEFILNISEWKYTNKVKEAMEEGEVTGRRMPSTVTKEQGRHVINGMGPPEGHEQGDFIDDDIPF